MFLRTAGFADIASLIKCTTSTWSLEWPNLSGGESRGSKLCLKRSNYTPDRSDEECDTLPSNWAECQYLWQPPANAITRASPTLWGRLTLLLSGHFLCAIFSQPLHINAANEAYMLQRPSSLFWCHSIKSLSCLEISSVTLTPMSSPESNLSAGLLTPPPAKPALLPPKPPEGCSIPRPRVNTLLFLSFCSVTAPQALISPAFVCLLPVSAFALT